MSDDFPSVEVASRAELRDWLAAEHARSSGIWLVTYKKAASPERYLTGDAIVEKARCLGWVDSRPRKVDEERSALLLTPRQSTSRWSRPNKERIARLESAGLLMPAGRSAVEAAKANGAGTALDAVEDLVEPDDLAAALDRDPPALEAAGMRSRARPSAASWSGSSAPSVRRPVSGASTRPSARQLSAAAPTSGHAAERCARPFRQPAARGRRR